MKASYNAVKYMQVYLKHIRLLIEINRFVDRREHLLFNYPVACSPHLPMEVLILIHYFNF